MINEFHAAVTWQPLSSPLLSWQDFVDPSWRLPGIIHKSARVLRSTLIVADVPEAAAWAAYKMRSALKHSDFSSLGLFFDQREGYDVADQLATMTQLWSPVFGGDLANLSVFLSDSIVKSAYEIFNYTVTSDGTDLTVLSNTYGSLSKAWESEVRLSIRLPGTASTVDIPKFTGTGFITIASKPKVTLQDIGQSLANLRSTVLSDMVDEESIFDLGIRRRLAVTAADTTQPMDQFLAAGLLLAGYMKHNVTKSLKAIGAP